MSTRGAIGMRMPDGSVRAGTRLINLIENVKITKLLIEKPLVELIV